MPSQPLAADPVRDGFTSSPRPHWRPTRGWTWWPTSSAAIQAWARTLPPGHVLLPSCLCPVAIPRLRHGIVRWYHVRPDWRTTWAEIERGLTPHTVGVLAVQYFGWATVDPEVWARLRRLGLASFEDAAQGAASRDPEGRWLGTHGDAGAVSLWKVWSGMGALAHGLPGREPPRPVRWLDVKPIAAYRRLMAWAWRRVYPSAWPLERGTVPLLLPVPASTSITHRACRWPARLQRGNRDVYHQANAQRRAWQFLPVHHGRGERGDRWSSSTMC